MPDIIDYGRVDIEILLKDPSVQDFLKIADEHPMWKVREMVGSLSDIQGRHTLTYEEAKIVLNRLELSTQSLRIAYLSKVRETGKHEYRDVQGAAKEIPKEQVQKAPEVTKIIQIRQVPVRKPASKKIELQAIVVDRISIFKGFRDFFKFIFGFRIRLASHYFVPVFLLFAGLIFWLGVRVFFQKEPAPQADVSLPVSAGKTAEIKGLQGVTSSKSAETRVK